MRWILNLVKILYKDEGMGYNDIRIILPFGRFGGIDMKVLLAGVSRKEAYKIIEGFYAALSSMNYPVKEYRAGLLRFIDVDEGFRMSELRFDAAGSRIILK